MEFVRPAGKNMASLYVCFWFCHFTLCFVSMFCTFGICLAPEVRACLSMCTFKRKNELIVNLSFLHSGLFFGLRRKNRPLCMLICKEVQSLAQVPAQAPAQVQV